MPFVTVGNLSRFLEKLKTYLGNSYLKLTGGTVKGDTEFESVVTLDEGANFTGGGNSYIVSANSGNLTVRCPPQNVELPILTAGNYTTYTPDKDGTGATGTWPINITGNATNDSDGNKIVDTYAKKTDVPTDVVTNPMENDLVMVGAIKLGNNRTGRIESVSSTGTRFTSDVEMYVQTGKELYISGTPTYISSGKTIRFLASDGVENKRHNYLYTPVSKDFLLSLSSDTHTISASSFDAELSEKTLVLLDIAPTATKDQFDALGKAKIVATVSTSGITLKLLGTVPTIAIPVVITVFDKM